MNDWFTSFHRVLQGGSPTEDLGLVPAGSSSMDAMLKHVRYQFSSKTREAVEETFPKSIARMGQQKWDEVWESFLAAAPASPRSLDRYPGVFLEFFLATEAPHGLKELLRFEWAIDTHPWTHGRLERLELLGVELSGEVVIELAPLDIQRFQAPVIALYEGLEVLDDHEPQEVLLWLMNDGVHFHRLESWEESCLRGLGTNLAAGLQHAPEEPQAVSEFFEWLGSSGLIRAIRPSSAPS